MIKIIYGAKGSGKTKRIIDLANSCIGDTNIAFVTDTDRYSFEISSKIRYINSQEFNIKTELGLSGFIRGLVAGDHDLKSIYIDGAHRMVNKNIAEMKELYTMLDTLSKENGVDFCLTVSAVKEELPDFILKYIK
ncbi:MAG: hypothetical protein RR454_02330 [Clostridia bacterium]